MWSRMPGSDKLLVIVGTVAGAFVALTMWMVISLTPDPAPRIVSPEIVGPASANEPPAQQQAPADHPLPTVLKGDRN